MVQLTRIYTRGGDKGKTSLGDGTRLAKHAARMAAIGTVDEANAAFGIVQLHVTEEPDAAAMLTRVQNDLFDLGADLCTPEQDDPPYPPLRIVTEQVERLEAEIDAMNEELEPLTSFVLPGGTPAAAHLHLARTIVRRAERTMTELAEKEPVNSVAIQYVNRLSDHAFVMARWLNNKRDGDVLWIPGQNR
ncbi:MAG: cob(I)yrinic acid a,c-diamide adenosyltransferase [Pseudomonadota bacterium]